MKYISLLFLCSCAVGVEIEPSPQKDNYYYSPQPVSNYTEVVKDNKFNAKDLDCQIVSYWIGDCVIIKSYCNEHLIDQDIKCLPEEFQLPFKWLPDPPLDR